MASQGSNPRNREEDQGPPRRERPGEDRTEPSGAEEPDVFLDIPMLEVEEIDLEVEDLRAHISVRAELVNFVNINIGVDAYLNHLKLQVKGVEAQAQLKVRLDKILGTIDRALSAIEANPDLLNQQTRSEQPGGRSGGRDAERADESADERAGQAQPSMPGIPAATGPSLELEQGGESPDGDTSEVKATEAALRKARELGVDLTIVEPTGSRGRILVGDVKRAANG